MQRNFLKEKFYDVDTHIPIVYKIKVSCNNTAYIDDDLFIKLASIYIGEDSIKNYIPKLRKQKFDSWFTTGHWDHQKYNDIAVFEDKCIHIAGVSFKIKNKWSKYMSVDKAEEYLQRLNK